MAAAVTAKYDLRITADETLALGLDHGTDTPFEHTLGVHNGKLTATTTPAATKVFSDNIALSSGSATLDLTSLSGPATTTVDFTGLKVQLIKLTCPLTNTAGITVDAKDASTGYNLFGADNAATTEKQEVLPGCVASFFMNDKLEDVDSTHKDLTLTGTGTEAINVLLIAG